MGSIFVLSIFAFTAGIIFYLISDDCLETQYAYTTQTNAQNYTTPLTSPGTTGITGTNEITGTSEITGSTGHTGSTTPGTGSKAPKISGGVVTNGHECAAIGR